MDNPASSGCDLSSVNDPSGFARCHADFDRFSFGSDSGNTNSPYRKFPRLKIAAAQNGARRLYCPSNPPTAGPTTNPTPNAAPSIPNLFARSAGAEISVMYANAVDTFDAVIPLISLPTNSHLNDGASAMKM